MKYDKLVRDKIIDIIEKNGDIAIYRTLDENEFKKYLEKKFYEELKEVIEANPSNKLEELSDLFEVMVNYANLYGIDLNDIINKSNEKNKLRGSFKKRILLIETKKK